MNVLNREVFDKQTASIFPSWTSRVRSPSPAFSFIDLRAYRFRKYSKYSVKKQDVRYLRAFAPESALQTKPLAGAEGRVFVTASLGFCRHPQQVAPTLRRGRERPRSWPRIASWQAEHPYCHVLRRKKAKTKAALDSKAARGETFACLS
jgi:hypothetical protein